MTKIKKEEVEDRVESLEKRFAVFEARYVRYVDELGRLRAIDNSERDELKDRITEIEDIRVRFMDLVAAIRAEQVRSCNSRS